MIEITHEDLALEVSAPRASNRVGWNWEPKYDGFRVLVTNLGGRVRLTSRNGKELGPAFPELVEELRPRRRKFALDGELVVLDHLGTPRFDVLATRARMKKAATIEPAARRNPAVFFAFDALVLNGRDLRELPFRKRKARLLQILKNGQRVRCLHHIEERGEVLYDQAVKVEFEGAIHKARPEKFSEGSSGSA